MAEVEIFEESANARVPINNKYIIHAFAICALCASKMWQNACGVTIFKLRLSISNIKWVFFGKEKFRQTRYNNFQIHVIYKYNCKRLFQI